MNNIWSDFSAVKICFAEQAKEKYGKNEFFNVRNA
jgi:hypothetical protein